MTDHVPFLKDITDTARCISPIEQLKVFGETFLANLELNETDRNPESYDPGKIAIYKSIVDHHHEKSQVVRVWDHYTGQNYQPKPVLDIASEEHVEESLIDDRNYWNSIVEQYADEIPDSPEKEAFIAYDILQSSPQEAAEICNRLIPFLNKAIEAQKEVSKAKTIGNGKRRSAITKEIKEENPCPVGMNAEFYKNCLSGTTHVDERVVKDRQEEKHEQKKGTKLEKLARVIRDLGKAASSIQQRMDNIENFSNHPNQKEKIFLTINEIIQENNVARQIIAEQFSSQQISLDEARLHYITAELKQANELHNCGVYNRMDFLQEMLLCGDVVESLDFKETLKTLYDGKFAEVSNKYDHMIIASYAPKNPVSEYTPEDIFALFTLRANTYLHLDAVMKNIEENSYIQKPEQDQLDSLQEEILYSTIFPNYQIEIRMGIGGSTVGEPLARLPAYLLPAIHILEATDKANKSSPENIKTNVPKLHVFSAEKISSDVNNFENIGAERTAALSLEFMSNYVSMIHPDIADHINFAALKNSEINSDKTISACQKAGGHLLKLYTKESIPDELAEILTESGITHEELGRAIDSMGKRAYKHDYKKTTPSSGDEALDFDSLIKSKQTDYIERGIGYAAYHPTASLFGDISHKDLVKKNVHKVIKLGGQGEHYFNLLQRVISTIAMKQDDKIIACNNPKKNSIFLTGNSGCNPAPYYEGEGDIRLSHIYAENLNEKIAFLATVDSKLSTVNDWEMLRKELLQKKKICPMGDLTETIQLIGSFAPEEARMTGGKVIPMKCFA